MTDGQIRAAARRAEIPLLCAYRLWFEHTRKCDGGCKRVHMAHDGCEAGRELWGAYRLTRIGRAT